MFRERATRLAGVPERYVGVEPSDEFVGGAYMWGPAGTGKTHAACQALAEFVGRHVVELAGGYMSYVGPRARFVTVPEWLSRVRSTYGGDESEHDVVMAVAKAGFLVLDDIGKGKPTEWALERIYTIINYRYENELPTVITSNYTVAALGERLACGDEETAVAIVSRIVGMGPRVEFAGRDRRLTN